MEATIQDLEMIFKGTALYDIFTEAVKDVEKQFDKERKNDKKIDRGAER